MKGVSEVIAGILILAIAMGLMSVFYAFYSSSSQEAMQNVEDQGKNRDCERNANFMITSVEGNIVSIYNNGGTNLNTSLFSGYIHDAPVQITVTATILKPGDNITIQLSQTPALGSKVKIMGDCNLGDEFYVK